MAYIRISSIILCILFLTSTYYCDFTYIFSCVFSSLCVKYIESSCLIPIYFNISTLWRLFLNFFKNLRCMHWKSYHRLPDYFWLIFNIIFENGCATAYANFCKTVRIFLVNQLHFPHLFSTIRLWNVNILNSVNGIDHFCCSKRWMKNICTVIYEGY